MNGTIRSFAALALATGLTLTTVACAAAAANAPTPPRAASGSSQDEMAWRDEPPLAVAAVETVELPAYFGRQPHLFEGDLWLFDGDTGELVRADAVTLAVKARFPIGEARSGIPDVHGATQLDGLVWTGRNKNGGFVAIDPATNTIVADFDSDVRPYALAAGDGVIWASDFEGGLVASIDPATGQVLTRTDVPNPMGLTITDEGVWVVLHRVGEVALIDQTSGDIIERVRVGELPENIVPAAGAVWVSLNAMSGRGVARIDPATREVTNVRTGAPTYAVWGDDETLWAGSGPRDCKTPGRVVRIDPQTSTVTGWVEAPCPMWAAEIGGRLAVTDDFAMRIDWFDVRG